jgi:predicted RNA binding protein YcfA (HicA-like mRNA interferase family)
MNPRRLLEKLAGGSLNNIEFNEFVRLVEALGFVERGVRGSHHVFVHPGLPELINLQPLKGQAKPYQIRQFLRLVEAYHLTLEGEE